MSRDSVRLDRHQVSAVQTDLAVLGGIALFFVILAS